MEKTHYSITRIVYNSVCYELFSLKITLIPKQPVEMDHKHNKRMPPHPNPKPFELHNAFTQLIDIKLHNRYRLWLLANNTIIKRQSLSKRLMVDKLATI